MASNSKSTSTGHVVEFHYDISCPFAYIASTKIQSLATRTSATIIYRPVLLGAIYRATSAPQGAAGSASDIYNPTKKTLTSQAFTRTILRHGIPYKDPPQHPMKTTAALRLLYYISESDRPALTAALFRAYWVEGKNITLKSTLKEAIQESHLSNSKEILQALEDNSFQGPKQHHLLEKATQEAIQRGTPGVPAFYLPSETWTTHTGNLRKGRLYWGQDRLHFVEATLQSLNQNHPSLSPAIPQKLLHLLPRVLSPSKSKIPPKTHITLEFYHDFSSPWSYLAWTQLPRLLSHFGPSNLTIVLKPFVLGILFREIGAPDTPTSVMSRQKREYMRLDHGDWVRFWNAVNLQEGGKRESQVEFFWAEEFPIRTVDLLRVAIIEEGVVDLLYRACWSQNLKISSKEILLQVLNSAGHDAKTLLEKSQTPEIKAKLRANTLEAQKLGICGAPTYRILRKTLGSEGEEEWKQVGGLVWGQDEISVVEDLIAGWDGEGLARVWGEEEEGRGRRGEGSRL